MEIVISGKFASFGVYSKITDKDRKKALNLIKLLGIKHIVDRDYKVISQGEKQKILIARALMAEPLVLLLDEPAVGLDIKARNNLLESTSKICKETKTTVIYITHHIDEIVKEIDNVFLIKSGQVFKQGKKKSILTKGNLDRLFE